MSIKNVFDEISSFDNVIVAERNTSAGKRYEDEKLQFWCRYEENIHYIVDSFNSLKLPPDTYKSFYVYEPKLRKVVYSDYITKIIQRSCYNILNPIVCRGLIEDTDSCVKGRGHINSMLKLSKWVNYVSDSKERYYYLKMDVEKFFYRIDHEVLCKIIRKKISDKRTLFVLEHYINNASKAFGLPLGITNPLEVPDEEMLWDKGIAIGGGLSHMYGNMYLDPVDQLIKRKYHIKYYKRYMDDFVLLSSDKSELHKIKREISEYIEDELKLRLNNRTAIRPVSQGIEFVGHNIFPGYVRLRKSTALHMKRHLAEVQEQYRNYEISYEKARETLMSYLALMDKSDCRELRKNILDNFVLTHNPKGEEDRCVIQTY